MVQAVLPNYSVDPAVVKIKALFGCHPQVVQHNRIQNKAPPSEAQSCQPEPDQALHIALPDHAAKCMRVLACANGEAACSAHQAFCFGLGQVTQQGLLLRLLLEQVMLLLLST